MENQQVMTQAFVQAAVEVAKAAVQALREAAGTTECTRAVPTHSPSLRISTLSLKQTAFN